MSNNFDILEALWLRRERKRRAQKTIEGAPPLTYTAKNAGTLKNYRIYGNTVDGESVGDKTKNLWGAEIVDNHSSLSNGTIISYKGRCSNIEPIVVNGNSYTFSYSAPSNTSCVVMIKNSGELISRKFKSGSEIVIDTSGGNELYITWFISDAIPITSDMIRDIMLNPGSTPLPYEPYGYKVPVTVSNGTDSQTIPIYLPEQIRKVGDEAEYIDYADQKQYFAGGTSVDVTLPALPTIAGTNTLSVGTKVQPSKVMVRGKLKD